MAADFFDTTIGEQITLQRGFDITKKQQQPGDVPVVSSGGISSFHNESKVQAPGVVLGRKGSLGTVFYLDEDYWPHDTTLWVKDFKGNNPRFVYYFFRNMAEALKKMDVGAANPALNRNHVHLLPTKWPKRKIQDHIDDLISVLDNKIQLNRQTNQTLEAMAQALFKSWFVDFDPVIDNALAAGHEIPPELQARAEARKSLQARAEQRKASLSGDSPEQESGDILPESIRQLFPNRFVLDAQMGWIPEGWEYVPFGKVAQCFDKHRVPLSKREREEKQPGNIPYYGATSVNDYINEWIFDDIFLLIGEDGSVMKEDGSPFVQYIWGKAWVNNHAHVLQGVNGVSTEHLMLFMQAQNITAYVTGAVQMKINQKNMNSIAFLKAGDEINKCFADFIRPFYESYRSYSEANDSLTKLRDTLLPKLISGELRLPESTSAAPQQETAAA
ncbi:restriction endonuclease subunit S [Endozoicomonas sp. SCSIO W0465]|uniref:restriction endonuclease subunit S n=1 Tax=Endozoicomonas sp. SCSIO W0465 TaxID=2918516 RepID=UPI0020750AAC|nr:restriction endonuclease subunit S [Endozoicomonas sp. SCSIO W0465]USE36455.1 restriction endonuclease subunit S [Endozoicomonas sp. SCSIO W0465]